MILFSDASHSGQKAGVSCIIKDGDRTVGAVTKVVPARDSTDAELAALRLAADWLIANNVESAVVCNDNHFAVDSVTGVAPRNKRYGKAVDAVTNLLKPFVLKWIPREENTDADALAVLARRRGTVSGPVVDFQI